VLGRSSEATKSTLLGVQSQANRKSVGLRNTDPKTMKAALALANAMPLTTRQQKRPSVYFKKSGKNANDSFFEEEDG